MKEVHLRSHFHLCIAGVLLMTLSVPCRWAFAADEGAPNAAPKRQMSQKEADIRKLLAVTGASKLGEQIFTQMLAQFRKSMPNVPREFWDKFQRQANFDDLVESIIPVYDKHFTDDEIKALTAFYESPVGRKVVHEMPQILQESMAIGQAWGQRMAKQALGQLKEQGYLQS